MTWADRCTLWKDVNQAEHTVIYNCFMYQNKTCSNTGFTDPVSVKSILEYTCYKFAMSMTLYLQLDFYYFMLPGKSDKCVDFFRYHHFLIKRIIDNKIHALEKTIIFPSL